MSHNVNSTGNTSCRRLNFEQENNSSGIEKENNARVDAYVDLEANEDVLEDDDSEIPEAKIPKFGMKFDTEESAYQFYNDYARALGFSIRKTSSHKDSNNNILDRKFCCSCQGQRGPDKRDKHVKSHRPETRFSCHAHMRISARGSGKYVIVGFVPEHNGHDLVSPNKTHFLRSQRKISAEQAAQIENFKKSGIPPKASMDYMAQQVGGRENVGFILEDLNNYLHSKRTMQMKEGDARGVLNYLQLKQSEDPNFSYAVQVDKDDLITNIFWADGQMMVDYIYFGDVVSFDTTYRKNKEGRPFALFVGVNHHKQTTVFGAALLYDETAETFMWLFDTFVKAMNGKKPITILTDQDAAMAKALEEKWPETRHRLCIWHIYQNAAIHLSHIFAKFSSFTKDLNSCIYDYEDEEDFLEAWQKMLDKYSLQDNDWLKRLFKKKEKWAMVYGRQTFCADMISTQRSESMNSVLKKYNTKREHALLGDQGDEDVEGVENPRWTSFKAVLLLLLGTVIAGVFADPLVDAVDNFSSATNIPTFFISFIALPLATNSSEAVSAIIFASRKKLRSASLTFSELYGAVTMNNTLCLSVFLALVYVRGLYWDFSSEVLVILMVCIVMGIFASVRTTFPLWTSLVAFLLYPLSLILVYVLDYVFGWS